jgi:peroxiredoxin
MSAVNSSPQSSSVRSNRPDVFVMLLLAASLCLNVYLGLKVKQGPVAENTAKLSPGMKIEPVTAVGGDGKPVTISYDGSTKPTVFYVISPSCIWCKRNQANINKLSDGKANEFRFIGISLAESGLKEYVEGYQLKFPVYTGLKEETIWSLGLGATPQTIVVSPEGKILKVWPGAYVEDLRPEVEAYFGIQLPGLTPVGN